MRTQGKWRFIGRVTLVALLLVPLGAWLATSAAAQNSGSVRGQVRDLEGKPFPGVVVQIKNVSQGQNYEVKTDKNGSFLQAGLPGGDYELAMKVKDTVVHQSTFHLASGAEHLEDVNFKDEKSKQSAQAAEAQKKNEEEGKKFEGMKGHFDAGVAGLEQARQLRGEAQRAPADQRAAAQEKVSQAADQAVAEFQGAIQSMSETDLNRHLVFAKLGETYEVEGKFDEAVAAYQKAIELKPDQAPYYNNLGNALAKQGKIAEAGAAYQKSATLDPTNAAQAWRNLGVVLYNAGRTKEAIDPLKKSIELDPKSAQSWYMLAGALLAGADQKKEGDKIVIVFLPGTVEAYQKCIELDPNGGYGSQCKESLVGLQAMGAGIDTKLKNKPPPKKQP
jgi:tetratricopeptide (TPR) repeat protein